MHVNVYVCQSYARFTVPQKQHKSYNVLRIFDAVHPRILQFQHKIPALKWGRQMLFCLSHKLCAFIIQ